MNRVSLKGKRLGRPENLDRNFAILESYNSGKLMREVGEEFGVGQQTIQKIIERMVKRGYRLEKRAGEILREQICHEYHVDGDSVQEIAERHGVNQSYVYRVIQYSRSEI